MVRLRRGYNNFAFHASRFGVSLTSLIAIFVLMCPSSTSGWKVGVRDQDKTCYLYSHQTKTCFIQSHVNGRIVLQLSLTPTSEADLTTPPHISWFRRVKLRNRHSLAVVNLLEGGRPPKFMELSANRTDLTINILSEKDMSRNSFKARVGSKGQGDHQNFVLESETIDIEAPEAGEFVAINTMDYFTIPGMESHFDWSKEGARHLPRNAGISHDGKRLVFRHYQPAEDSGVYVCEVYSPADYFIAGRRYILGSASHATTDLSAEGESKIDAPDQSGNNALLEQETSQEIFSWLQNEPDSNVAPLGISEMVHTFKNNGEIYYVLRESTQYLACFPSNMAAVDLTTIKLRYAWGRPTDSDVITTFDNGRFLTVDGGILEISDVGPRDSGSLECNVTYHDVIGQPRVKTYTYGIEVYTLPDFVYSVSAAYTSEDCDSPQRSAVFKQLLGTHLQASVIADDTSYEITDFVASCNNSLRLPTVGVGVGSVQGGRVNLIRFDVVVRQTMVTQCSMQCMVGEMDTKTRLIGMKLGAFFSRELEEQYGYHPSRLIPNSLQFDLKYRCDQGYGLQASICVACPPGSYSQQGNTECIQCPMSSYQPSYGAVDCVQCPTHEYTFWSGAISMDQCQVTTVIAWIMLGAFGMMALSGVIVSCVLYGYRMRHQKAATEDAPVTLPKTDIASKKPSRKTVKSKKHLSRSDISSSAHHGELEVLLESSDDDDTNVNDEGLQSHVAPVSYQTGSQEESNIYHYRSQETRRGLQAQDRTNYEHREEDIGLYHSVQKGDINASDGRTNQETINSYLPDNEVLDHQQQRDPLDQLSRSQMVNELGPNEQHRLSRPSLHYSNRDDTYRGIVISQLKSPSKVYSGMASYEPPPQAHVTFPSHQAFIPDAQEAQLTPKLSSQIGNLISPLQPQGSSPSDRHVPLQEDSFQSKRHLSPSFHDHLDNSFSPSYTQRQTLVASPSQISSASSTSLPIGRELSFSSAGPSTPLSSRPSSRSDLIGSPVVPVDLSDETDSEIEIGSFIVEGDNLQPSEETRRSSFISKPHISPRRNSVAALIASYQSLSRSGPTTTAPQVNQILDQSSFESTTTHSTKTSAFSMKGKPSNATVPPGSPPLFPRTFSREKSMPIIFSDRAPSDFLARQSPPRSPQKDQSRTLTPSISPVKAVTPVISPPRSSGAVTGDVQQTPSRTATLTQDELGIPPFSLPITPQEALSPSRSKGFTPSLAFSENSGHTPPVTPSVQSSQVSPKESLMTRRSSLMTSPAGRPANPFQLQRLRRQSLAGQKSSHLTATLTSTPHLETASADGGVSPPAQNEAILAPPSFPSIPVFPTVASSLHMDTPSAVPPSVVPPAVTTPTSTTPPLNVAPPAIVAHPSAPALPDTPSTFAPPPPPTGPFPPASTPPHSISAHPSLVTRPSVSVSIPININDTAPVGEPPPLPQGVPPPPPPLAGHSQ
ncbi:uncharacterized protein LOC119744381 [Patiria miniata]|uniref:Ig-like domain-containing protein n=1 Tax=Patiria miniata TaxID=46514 RepID=A0A914BK81_PATMI|nr:uncharacterized protein LOC119744381 [Patiria miniata]